MKILFIFLLYLGINIHDIQVANYKIHQQNTNLVIEFVFEDKDILYAFDDLNTDLSNKTLHEYINSNFSISINNKPFTIELGNMTAEHKHIFLIGQIPNINQAIHHIEINNTCLSNIEDHSNIIELKLHDRQRDFLMNSDRTSIEIEY